MQNQIRKLIKTQLQRIFISRPNILVLIQIKITSQLKSMQLVHILKSMQLVHILKNAIAE